MTEPTVKPLKRKAYGSIGHLPESRLGPGDWHVHEGQARIACLKPRDRHDRIIVTEKLDGSCTAVARIGDEIVALGRAGYLADTSPYEQHRMFSEWVAANAARFLEALRDGERMVGEWLAQAHGTRYPEFTEGPWFPFDVMAAEVRLTHDEAIERVNAAGLTPVPLLSDGPAFSVEQAEAAIGEYGTLGALDRAEGAVWRVERQGKFDYLAKYVRTGKTDGAYLPEISGGEAVWNWHAARPGGMPAQEVK